MNIEVVESGTSRRKAITIRRFCADWDISPAFYFKLQQQGRGPRTLRLGAKVLITDDAEADWASELQRETA